MLGDTNLALACLGVWLQLVFKVLFVLKYIKIMFFFHFLKIIFEINESKRSKTYKKKLIFKEKN